MADVHFDRGLLLVREGKGGRDRYVPIGQRAMRWLRRYLDRSRPELSHVAPPGPAIQKLAHTRRLQCTNV